MGSGNCPPEEREAQSDPSVRRREGKQHGFALNNETLTANSLFLRQGVLTLSEKQQEGLLTSSAHELPLLTCYSSIVICFLNHAKTGNEACLTDAALTFTAKCPSSALG